MIISRNFAVREATQKMGHAINEPLSRSVLAYRLDIMFQEMREMAIEGQRVMEGLMQKRGPAEMDARFTKLLKEMMDVAYTIEGTCVAFGADSDRAFELVHEENMTKDKPENKFSKWVKGPTFQKADLTSCLRNTTTTSLPPAPQA